MSEGTAVDSPFKRYIVLPFVLTLGLWLFQVSVDSGSEETAMTSKLGNGTARRSAAIPPIDASLPGVTETATFALG
jgi:hypothetical protein